MGTPPGETDAASKKPVHLRAAPTPTQTQEMMAFDPSTLGGGGPADARANAVETRCGQWVAPLDVCESAQQARRRARDEGRAICQPCLTFATAGPA